MIRWVEKKKANNLKAYHCEVPVAGTLNRGRIKVVADIIEEADKLSYTVKFEDTYLRSLPTKPEYTKNIIVGERPNKDVQKLKEFIENGIVYEQNRCQGNIFDHATLYNLYNENLEDIVAHQMGDEYYKAIGVSNGLSGNVMIYGGGHTPGRRDWKITGFPVKFEIEDLD